MTKSDPGTARSQLLTVTVGGETFGLPIALVRTIFRIGPVTRVPLGPPAVLGLVNLRGAVIPAVSLRRRLGLQDTAAADGVLAVALELGSECFALVVDEVGDVISVEDRDALPLPPHLVPGRAVLTEAVYRLPDAILPVLGVAALARPPDVATTASAPAA